jgi:transketolase
MNHENMDDKAIHELCINTIRTLSMDAIQKANSGHPGAPMGLAPAGYVLWTGVMKHSPKNPDWLDRDRFVLSAGHASMLLYSLLHLTGYDLSLDDIKNFRQLNSKTPGHPEFGKTPGVETTTGPLGQGFANAVGMAIAEAHLGARFNRANHKIIDHYTYAICGDGDLMEGVCFESASFAGHLGLGRLICIYDDNDISIEGPTDITFTDDVELRFQACNWHVLKVSDGNDTEQIFNALNAAKAETEKPSLIILKTNIAYGSPGKQDSADAHGAPLGEEEVRLTKERLQWPQDKTFFVPKEVLNKCRKCIETGNAFEAEWQGRFDAYKEAFPELATDLADAVSGFMPRSLDDAFPDFPSSDPSIATRAASGKVLNAIAEKLPTLMGGSADLAPSNKTYINNSDEFQKNAYNGRNIRFGVREHCMGAVMNGMFLHNGIRPYGGTFLVFSDYMRPAIRAACLMKLPVIYIFTHDSIAVGEDGPTHQPVEHIASLRNIPGLTVIRPADASETAAAWRCAIRSTSSPTALILSRQKLNILNTGNVYPLVAHGAYTLYYSYDGKPDIILMASGSEVFSIIMAKKLLEKKGIKVCVVSMPSFELFEKTSKEYQDIILPPDITARLAVEAGIATGWERYVGDKGAVLGVRDFGASAPGSVLMENAGFTPENIAEKAEKLL